jgi:hypothetical protein
MRAPDKQGWRWYGGCCRRRRGVVLAEVAASRLPKRELALAVAGLAGGQRGNTINFNERRGPSTTRALAGWHNQLKLMHNQPTAELRCSPRSSTPPALALVHPPVRALAVCVAVARRATAHAHLEEPHRLPAGAAVGAGPAGLRPGRPPAAAPPAAAPQALGAPARRRLRQLLRQLHLLLPSVPRLLLRISTSTRTLQLRAGAALTRARLQPGAWQHVHGATSSLLWAAAWFAAAAGQDGRQVRGCQRVHAGHSSAVADVAAPLQQGLLDVLPDPAQQHSRSIRAGRAGAHSQMGNRTYRGLGPRQLHGPPARLRQRPTWAPSAAALHRGPAAPAPAPSAAWTAWPAAARTAAGRRAAAATTAGPAGGAPPAGCSTPPAAAAPSCVLPPTPPAAGPAAGT